MSRRNSHRRTRVSVLQGIVDGQDRRRTRVSVLQGKGMVVRTLLVALVAFGGLAAYLAVLQIDSRAESPVRSTEVLYAPGFDDVSRFDDSDIARIDSWLREQVALAQYPSLSVAVVRGGKIAYEGTFGFEDLRARRKATPATSCFEPAQIVTPIRRARKRSARSK